MTSKSKLRGIGGIIELHVKKILHETHLIIIITQIKITRVTTIIRFSKENLKFIKKLQSNFIFIAMLTVKKVETSH